MITSSFHLQLSQINRVSAGLKSSFINTILCAGKGVRMVFVRTRTRLYIRPQQVSESQQVFMSLSVRTWSPSSVLSDYFKLVIH